MTCTHDCNPLTGCQHCCPVNTGDKHWGNCPQCHSDNIFPDYGHANDYDELAYDCNQCGHWWIKNA